MKKILSLITVLGISTSLMAQDIKLAPEVGGLYQTMILKLNDEVLETQFQPGLRLGLNLDIGINTNFSIQTGAFVHLNSGTESYHEKNYFLGSGLPTSDKDSRRYHINYLRIPVYALYKTGKEFDDPHFFIGAGPYVSAVIGGRFEQEYTNTLNGEPLTKRYDYALRVGNEEKDNVKRFDFGVQATIGYEMPFGLYFRGHYGIGLLNVYPGSLNRSHFRNHGGGISVGYFFDLSQRNVWER